MKSQNQNFNYARDSEGHLIHVSSAERKKNYYCPICDTLMTPHMGKIRKWHFVHKINSKCSYETYLHTIAKERIKEAFLSSESFYLSYTAKAICNVNCPFVGYSKCLREKPVKFDLRKYYDKCEIEASYHHFKADLLLTSSQYPEREPILIEIKVTHECTSQKINEGCRIIEIPISSEKQIDDIIDNSVFSGVRDRHVKPIYITGQDEDATEPITLYNFNKCTKFSPEEKIYWTDILNLRKTIVVCLDRTGGFRTFNCHCYEVYKKIPQNVHYFVSNLATPYKYIFQGFSARGVKMRNCFLCRFSKKNNGERICVLYKKYDLPQKPSPYVAANCSHYIEDTDIQASTLKLALLENTNIGCIKSYFYICEHIL